MRRDAFVKEYGERRELYQMSRDERKDTQVVRRVPGAVWDAYHNARLSLRNLEAYIRQLPTTVLPARKK